MSLFTFVFSLVLGIMHGFSQNSPAFETLLVFVVMGVGGILKPIIDRHSFNPPSVLVSIFRGLVGQLPMTLVMVLYWAVIRVLIFAAS